mgnify:FL=1
MKPGKIEAKKQLPKVEFYRFLKEYKNGGITISKDVVLKGVFVLVSDCVSLVGSSVFSSIPLEYVEKFEPVVRQKVSKKKKKIEAKDTGRKMGSESARVSDRTV